MKEFNKKLKELRKEKALSPKEVGKRTNTSEMTIQNYERNIRKPTIENLIKIADYFEVSIDWLCGRTEKREINK